MGVKHSAWIVALLALFVFIADQTTKYAVVAFVGMGRFWMPFPPLASVIAVTPGYNTGTACGYLPEFGRIFTFAPLLIVAIVIVFYVRQARPGWLLTLSTGLILGGAFGNLVDRLRLGYVVDYVRISRWPVFNVADAAVSTAIVLLLLWSLREDVTRSQVQAKGAASVDGFAAKAPSSTTWKLALSFLVLLAFLAALGFFVCVYVPANLLP